MSSQAREKSANEKIEIQEIWISLTILLNMSLSQLYFAWDFSKKFRSGIGHIHVRSLFLITIFSSNRESGFATEQKRLAWEFRPGFLSKILAFFLNIHPERALYYCLKGVFCQTGVSVFRHCPCYRSIIDTLKWKKEDDL